MNLNLNLSYGLSCGANIVLSMALAALKIVFYADLRRNNELRSFIQNKVETCTTAFSISLILTGHFLLSLN